MLFRLTAIVPVVAAIWFSTSAIAADETVRIPYLPDVGAALPERDESTTKDSPEQSGEYSVRVLLSAPREARLSSQMRGRITAIPVSLGDRFSKGDLLVAFGCDHQQAELMSAEAERSKAKRKLQSQEALQKLDAVSSLDVELARADLEVARASVAQAEARVNDCSIHAPYGGSVVRVMANEYEIVEPGADLLQIVETGTLRLEALIPSSWLVWIRKEETFSVHVDEIDTRVEARVTAIGSMVDPVSQTIGIQARIVDVPPGLLPGMSGDAKFEGPG